VSSPLDREERKRFLVLACACDRVELALALRRPNKPLDVVSGLLSGSWGQVAGRVLTPLLPRKLRFASFLYRLWQNKS
jgi:hypothetical protein